MKKIDFIHLFSLFVFFVFPSNIIAKSDDVIPTLEKLKNYTYFYTVGDTILIEKSPIAYWEVPDTIWYKKKKNPKEFKHFNLILEYKQSLPDKNHYVPSHPSLQEVRDNKYVILSITKHKESEYSSNYFNTLHLLRVDTNERIKINVGQDDELEFQILNIENQIRSKYTGLSFYKLKDENIEKLRYRLIDNLSYDEKREILQNPLSYEKISFENFFLNYSSTGYRSTVLEILLNNGTQFNIRDYSNMNMITIDEYKKLCRNKVNSLINKGSYHIIFNNMKLNNRTITIQKGLYQDLNRVCYKNNILELTLEPLIEYFSINLENKSGSIIRLDWNNIVFVDEYRQSQVVTHNGIRFSEANKEKQPSIVAPYSTFNDVIIPSHRIRYSTYNYEWSVLGILDYMYVYGKYPEGTKLSLMIPIEYNGKINHFYYTFDVIWKYTYPELRKLYENGTDIETLVTLLYD